MSENVGFVPTMDVLMGIILTNRWIYIYCIYIYMWQGPLGSISFVGLERHLLQSNERYSKHLYNRARLSEALDVDRRQ